MCTVDYITKDEPKAATFIARKIFSDYLVQVNYKIEQILANQDLTKEKPLFKFLAKEEDVIYNQLLQALGTISEFCLPSLLRILIQWYHNHPMDDWMNNNNNSSTNNVIAITPSSPDINASSGSLTEESCIQIASPTNNNNVTPATTPTGNSNLLSSNLHGDSVSGDNSARSTTSYVFNDKKLIVEYAFCQALIEIFSQLSLHPGYEELIEQIIDIAFDHFKQVDNKTGSDSPSQKDVININQLADKYAEVIGVLAQNRFKLVKKRFMLELNKLRADESDKKIQSIVALLSGIRYFRVKMAPIEDFESCMQFLQELGDYFLEVRQKSIKHALANLFVEIMIPLASSVKNEVKIPCLKNFVDSLWTQTLDMSSRKKHTTILFPLVTCLLCLSQRSFFLANWTVFLNMCLSNLKNRDQKMCRIALDSLYRLIWIYMVRIRGESNNVTHNRLQLIVDAIFPRNSRQIVPRDAPISLFVDMIHFIAQERLDFAIRHIIYDLLSVERPCKVIVAPERINIGLQSFIMIANSLQMKEGEPTMPKCLLSSVPTSAYDTSNLTWKSTNGVGPSTVSNSIRSVNWPVINKTLSEDTAKSIGLNPYYPTIQKAFNDILKALNTQIGKPYLLTNTSQQQHFTQPSNTHHNSSHSQHINNISNNITINNNINSNHQSHNQADASSGSLSLSLNINNCSSGAGSGVSSNRHSLISDRTSRENHFHVQSHFHDHHATDILNHQYHHLERSLSSLTSSSIYSNHSSSDRKPKIELLRTCIKIIPRLLPDGMTKEELIEFLAKMTIHVDETIRTLAVDTLKTLVKDFLDWRLLTIEGFTLFLIHHLDESTQLQLVDNSLRILLELLHVWEAAISLQPVNNCEKCQDNCNNNNNSNGNNNNNNCCNNKIQQQTSNNTDNKSLSTNNQLQETSQTPTPTMSPDETGRQSSLASMSCNIKQSHVLNNLIMSSNSNSSNGHHQPNNTKNQHKNASIRSTNTIVSIQTGYETISSRQSGPVGQIAARKSRALAEMRLIQTELANIPYHRLISVLQKVEGASLMLMCNQNEPTRHLANHLLSESRSIILCYAGWTRMDQFGFKSHGELDLDEEEFLTSIKGSLSDDSLSAQILALSGTGPLECNADAFPLHVIILLTHLLSNYDDPSQFSLDIARRIVIWCEENQSPDHDLENLGTVMNLYSRRSFSKDAFQWTKCVVKYLMDAFPESLGQTIPLAIDLLENGPERIQQLVAPILYCLLTYVDPMASGHDDYSSSTTTPAAILKSAINYPMEALNTDLLRIYQKYLGTSQWAEALQIFKLIISRSSSFGVGTSGSSFGRSELPGRTMDFTLDLEPILMS